MIMSKKQGVIIRIFGIMYIYLLLLHNCIGVQFDDYSYFTLSYPSIIDGVSGRNWTFMQMLEFIKVHYNIWGGRILFFGIELSVYKIGGIVLLQIVQATIILAIIFCIYKIISRNNNSVIATIIACCSYGFFMAQVTKESIYWFSASNSYVWPMLPFMVYILWTLEEEKGLLKNIGICIIVFIASFSQEQIGFAVVIYSLIIIIYDFWDKRKIIKAHIVNLISSVLGFSILYFAPGNFVRGAGDTFYEQNIFIIIKIAFKNMLNGLFSKDDWLFVIFMLVLSAYLVSYIKNQINNTVIKIAHVVIEYCLYFIAVIILFTQGQIFVDIYDINTRFFNTVTLLVLLIIIYSHLMALWIKNLKYEMIIMIVAISTVAPGLYTSYWVPRMIIPFMFLYFIISGIIALDILDDTNKEKIYKITLSALMIAAIINSATILKGYTIEKNINDQNIKALTQAAKEQNSDQIVILKKNKDCRYFALVAWILPEEGTGRVGMENNMKRYYGIDGNVKFEWQD